MSGVSTGTDKVAHVDLLDPWRVSGGGAPFEHKQETGVGFFSACVEVPFFFPFSSSPFEVMNNQMPLNPT